MTELTSEQKYGFYPPSTERRKEDTHWWSELNQQWIKARGCDAFRSKSFGKLWSRPVEVGEGWELVPLSATISDQDEHFGICGVWWKTTGVKGKTVSSQVRDCSIVHAFRRRKSAPETVTERFWQLGGELTFKDFSSYEAAEKEAKEWALKGENCLIQELTRRPIARVVPVPASVKVERI